MSGQYGVMIPGETCFKFSSPNGRQGVSKFLNSSNRRKSLAQLSNQLAAASSANTTMENHDSFTSTPEQRYNNDDDETSTHEEKLIKNVVSDEVVLEGATGGNKKTKGRVKIKMEFIDNKLRRYTTFSKRKTGIMKKAYELSTLTGTQVMLLVASETGHVYTFATKKLQPMITSDAGKALIQGCLNSPDTDPCSHNSTTCATSSNRRAMMCTEKEISSVLNMSNDRVQSSPINLMTNHNNQKRKELRMGCQRKRFKTVGGAQSSTPITRLLPQNGFSMSTKAAAKQVASSVSSFAFSPTLSDLPTMVPPATMASSFFSSSGSTGSVEQRSPASTPTSCSSSSTLANDEETQGTLSYASRIISIPQTTAESTFPVTDPDKKNFCNIQSASGAAPRINGSFTNEEQNLFISSLLQSVMSSNAMANDKIYQECKSDGNKTKNENGQQNSPRTTSTASLGSQIFPFSSLLPAALGQGQAAGFGFMPAGIAPNGTVMYQMPQGLVYAAPPNISLKAEKPGTGQIVPSSGNENVPQQQQYITIPFPVPFNQTMLASQLLNGFLADHQSQIKKSPSVSNDD